MNVRKSFLAWREGVRASKAKFVWQVGVLMFGLPFGFVSSLVLVNSDDISNHPLWEKALIVAGMTLVVGPVVGWVWGRVMWALRPLWLASLRSWDSHEHRIAELEKRVTDLENGTVDASHPGKE